MLSGEVYKYMTNIHYLRNNIKSKIEVELAESLPIRNRNCEVIFYYSTNMCEGKLLFGEVKYVFLINDDREILSLDVSEIIEAKTRLNMMNAIILDTKEMNVTPELEDEYVELYNSFCELEFAETISKEDLMLIQRLRGVFNKLVPDSVLSDLYFSFGMDMFIYMDRFLNA